MRTGEGKPSGRKPPLSRKDAHEFALSMGSEVCRIVVRGGPGAFLDQLLCRYDPWMIPASPLLREGLLLNVTFVSAQPTSPAGRDTLRRPLHVQDDPDQMHASRWDFDLRLSRQPNPDKGWVARAVCELNVLSFDSMLRVAWSLILPRLGGFLVHACAVRAGESAVLLPGPSGSGKSTFAAKMPDADHVLTDELTAVMPSPAGGWRAFGTPFWGDFRRGGGSLRGYPLRAVALLEQRSKLKLETLSPAEALARLLGCFLYFGNDNKMAQRNVGLAMKLVAAVPVLSAQLTLKTPPYDLFSALRGHCETLDAPDVGVTARERISEFRWMLAKHGRYAYTPRGHSMKPWLRDGESVFVVQTKPPSAASFRAGQVLVYWTPGSTPQSDCLTCHRLIGKHAFGSGGERFFTKGDNASGISQFHHGKHSEILGCIVDGVSGGASPSLGDIAKLLLSLGTLPLMRWLGR